MIGVDGNAGGMGCRAGIFTGIGEDATAGDGDGDGWVVATEDGVAAVVTGVGVSIAACSSSLFPQAVIATIANIDRLR